MNKTFTEIAFTDYFRKVWSVWASHEDKGNCLMSKEDLESDFRTNVDESEDGEEFVVVIRQWLAAEDSDWIDLDMENPDVEVSFWFK